MNLIAIETSATAASVSIIRDDRVFAEYTLNNKKTHSVNLMPMLEDMVHKAGLELKDVDYIAVASGPGSFTGLRIGSATAKGLAHGLNIPIVEVPTLLGLATNGLVHKGYVIPLMDARRKQVYTAVFKSTGGVLEQVVEDQACTIEVLAKQVETLEEQLPILFLGDAVGNQVDVIIEDIKTYFTFVDYRFAPANIVNQSAASVGLAALNLIGTKSEVDCYHHGPTYIRMCQAERELKEKQDGNL